MVHPSQIRVQQPHLLTIKKNRKNHQQQTIITIITLSVAIKTFYTKDMTRMKMTILKKKSLKIMMMAVPLACKEGLLEEKLMQGSLLAPVSALIKVSTH